MFRCKKTLLSTVVAGQFLISPAALSEQLQPGPAATTMETIVVSGTKTPKALQDVAGSISVIDAETIDTQVVTDLNEIFKYDPSIQVTGSVGGAQNILVRGMGSDRILMIKDGMRMNEGYGANGQNDIVGRGFIDTDTLKQVEVAKGAASSLYGSDALGGIVVFTTKDASDYLQDGETVGGRVKLEYSDHSSQSGIAGTLALKTGGLEHLLNASYRDGEEQQNYQESNAPFNIESNSALYKAKWNINDDNAVNFIVDYYKQDVSGDSADGLLFYFRSLANYGYNIVSESTITEKESTAYKLQYTSTSNTPFFDYLNISLYNNTSEQSDEEYGQLDINAPMFGVVELRDMWKTGLYQQETSGFLSNASVALNEMHTLGYGFDYETTESLRTSHEYREVAGEATKDDLSNKFPTNDVNRLGIFINDEISFLGGDILVTPGVRFDQYDMDPNGALNGNGEAFAKISESQTSFNLGALYKVNGMLSAFAQYGQGFKVPAYDLAYIEHYNQATSTYIYEIVPSDDLSPEESDSLEIGIRGHIGDLIINAAIYYNEYDQFLATQLIDSETVLNEDGSFAYQYDTYQYQNIDSVTIKGAELAIDYAMSNNWSVFANASYQDGKDDTTDEYINTISPLSGVVGLTFDYADLSSQLTLNWAVRMTKVNAGEAEIAGYGSLDWSVNYHINDALTLNVLASNLLDKEYVRFINVAGHAAGDDLQGFTEPGRGVAANITYQF
ncbi:TonB-dependent hemoglobin/transferrin/lactoferrin family receptor [Thalassotalea mangrovi]|uniref:TonB-dependent hemoglobin/transferrin/lactoferrin family receptor n=1 Tax=Thalassotalea mangrovi TaxID=2572245 RepID=A0A4U1BA53_9GAMM|nr:TonB-dependent hemoglobin/transferrin/lactoferrin family receptor [Thalassotalea mangrovi]TKB47689.1 TonB-dependent hemoglobin/transferrin/lactoferrin family receptor [Thalassotalea mangrovi]